MKFKSDFLQEIHSRGFVYQSSDIGELDNLMSKKKITGYIGFDITSDSLHVGSLVQLMLLHWLDQYNHKAIALVGGGTTLVGDPSGKDKTRKILILNQIELNIQKIESTFNQFINLKGNGSIINNYEWLADLNYISFLRDIGSKLTINKMLTYESVKNRLDREQALTFLEFNYMLLQSYDFYHLKKNYDCVLQMGGSDQWGNIVCGIDLARRLSGVNLFGLTTPLLTTSSGKKMGKTENGAIWLNYDETANSHSTHPRDFWNYWRDKTENDLVGPWMRLFTNLSLKEINEYEKLQGEEIESAKEILATKITELVHGKDSNWNSIETFNFSKSEIEKGIGLLSLLSRDFLKLTNSNSESRRFVKSSAIKLNEKLILDEKYIVTLKDFDESQKLKVSMGKKKNIIIQITE